MWLSPQEALAANKKPKSKAQNPVENPFSLPLFPGAGLRNAGEPLSGRTAAQSASAQKKIVPSGAEALSNRAEPTRLKERQEKRLSPLRAFEAPVSIPLAACKGLPKTAPETALKTLGGCENDARTQLQKIVRTGCLSKMSVQNGNTIAIEYQDASRPPDLKKKRRTGYEVAGAATFRCIPWGGAGVRLVHQESSESSKSWDFTVVRVGGNVIIDSGQFETRFNSSKNSDESTVLRQGIIRFNPREVAANPYVKACSPAKKECGVWRTIDIEWEAAKRTPPDPTLDIVQDTLLGFENKATIAYKYASRGAVKPLPNVFWLLKNSFYGERYGKRLSAEVTGNGPGLCDWREADHQQGQGYEDRVLKPFVDELHKIFPELPPVLPIDYDLAVRGASCALCNAQGSCTSKEWGEID